MLKKNIDISGSFSCVSLYLLSSSQCDFAINAAVRLEPSVYWRLSPHVSRGLIQSLRSRTDLDVRPGDGQDGAGAPGCGADGAQRAAGVHRVHRDHRVARQERSEVGLPVEPQVGERHDIEKLKYTFSPKHVYKLGFTC